MNKKKIFFIQNKVRDLGFKKATNLKTYTKKLNTKKFKLVSLDHALMARILYKNQKTGEWLRFATPFNSMIDSDGVPHLPKLGKALNRFLSKHIGHTLMQYSILTMSLLFVKNDFIKKLKIRNHLLKNRYVVSPMCQYSANKGNPSDWHLFSFIEACNVRSKYFDVRVYCC